MPASNRSGTRRAGLFASRPIFLRARWLSLTLLLLGLVDVSERGFTFTANALPITKRIAVNSNKTRGTKKSRFTITTCPLNAFAKALHTVY